MWKMLLGFIVFAVLVVFVLMKSGADVDMSGEKHGGEATHVPEQTASAAASAPSAAEPASAPASAASN